MSVGNAIEANYPLGEIQQKEESQVGILKSLTGQASGSGCDKQERVRSAASQRGGVMKNLQRGVGRCLMAAVLAAVVVVGVGSMAAMAQTPSVDGEAWVQMPPYSEPIKVQYEVVDGQAIWQGDIVLGDVDEVERMSAMIEYRGTVSTLSPSAGLVSSQGLAVKDRNKRWPMGIVPYVFGVSVSSTQRSKIRQAIEDVEAQTSIKFNSVDSKSISQHFIQFKTVDNPGFCGGMSPVGKQGGGQVIEIHTKGCSVVAVGTLIHEILHSLGLFHEQQRADHGSYVKLIKNNYSGSSWEDDFGKKAGQIHVGEYDCESIMHYGKFTFSNGKGATVQPTGCFDRIADRPVAGDFDRDGSIDDVAVFRPNTGEWFFETNGDGKSESGLGMTWGVSSDLPVAGDFDGDGYNDDVALFRPSSGNWFFETNRDGKTDDWMKNWGLSGDLPIAGDFDGDGVSDDVGLYRPSKRDWYFETDGDGKTDDWMKNWGLSGDLPIAGDFDGDGVSDDVGLYRPSKGNWYYETTHDGETDESMGNWGITQDRPVAGDFADGNNLNGDVALFRPSDGDWYYETDRDGRTDDRMEDWGGALLGSNRLSKGDVATIKAIYLGEIEKRERCEDSGLTLFRDMQFEGPKAEFQGNASNVGSHLQGKASSMCISDGLTVTLYSEKNFRGDRTTLTGPLAITNLNDLERSSGKKWNDDIKSVRVLGICNCSDALGTLAGNKDDEATALSINGMELSRHGGNLTLNAHGQGIESLSLEMFGLSGERVLTKTSPGNSLRFRPMDDAGRPLANGVYLYRTTVRGMNGQVERSEVKKLVILR